MLSIGDLCNVSHRRSTLVPWRSAGHNSNGGRHGVRSRRRRSSPWTFDGLDYVDNGHDHVTRLVPRDVLDCPARLHHLHAGGGEA